MSFKNEQSIIELWDKFKQPNIRVVGVCKKRRVTEKKYLNKSWLEVSKFVENDKTMDPRTSTNPQSKEHGENHTKAHHNQVA